MGYRHYMYLIEKETINKIKNMSEAELFENYASKSDKAFYKLNKDEKPYFSILDLPMERIFEFGKLYWDDTAERIYSNGKPLFENKETQERYDDYYPYLVGKDGLLEAINIYKDKIVENYKDLFVENDKLCDPFFHIPFEKVEKSIAEKCVEHCRDMMGEWMRNKAINTNINDKDISSSWYYEYHIFDLVHLLKTIDFDKYDILFMGW